MPEKIYVGSGKERTFDSGGSVVTVTIDVDDLINACKDHGFTTEGGKRKIRLKVGSRRDIDRFGNTHFVEVDTWKPDGQSRAQSGSGGNGYQNGRQNANTAPSRASGGVSRGEPDFPDDIPF